MTNAPLREARQAWAHAQMELDTALTELIPAALAVDVRGGEELQRLLTPEHTHEVSELYGRAVGLWAKYRELLRQAAERGEPVS